MSGDGGPAHTVRRSRRTLTFGLLCAVATIVPAAAVSAQTEPEPTTTTTALPDPTTTTTTTTPPDPTTTTTTTTVPATVPLETVPPATVPPATVPAPAAPAAPVIVVAAHEAEYLGPLPLGGCSISTVVKLNTTSNDVICVERVLAGLGYSFEGPDTFFSVHSVNSLKVWQRGQGIPADGIVGPATGGLLGIWQTATPPAVPATPPPGTPGEYLGPLPLGGCSISTVVKLNTTSNDVICVERVLAGLGYSFEGPDTFFSVHSVNSLKAWQRGQGIPADGTVGPATGGRLGIWVGAAAPPPPATEEPGAYGLPANSGSGRRVVYSRAEQRIWAVESDGTVVKTHAVSGRRFEPYAGTYRVYSRSMYTYSAADPTIKWRYMVRFAYGPAGGRIGFHEIPTRYGVPLQSERQLGQPLSGGCVRQSTADAEWMWNWAGVGTTVVVL